MQAKLQATLQAVCRNRLCQARAVYYSIFLLSTIPSLGLAQQRVGASRNMVAAFQEDRNDFIIRMAEPTLEKQVKELQEGLKNQGIGKELRLTVETAIAGQPAREFVYNGRRELQQILQAFAKQHDLEIERKTENSYFFKKKGDTLPPPPINLSNPPQPPKDMSPEAALSKLEFEINQAFPNSSIQLTRVGRQILVRGRAHDVVEADRILKIIRSEYLERRGATGAITSQRTRGTSQPLGLSSIAGFSSLGTAIGFDSETTTLPGAFSDPLSPDVIDMLTIDGEQQVTLRVTVAEVNREAARSIGLNFGIYNGETPVFQNLTGGIIAPGAKIGGNLPTILDNGQVQLAINALRTVSLAKTLAEPNLTAFNGQRAEFRAGGQFPVPVVAGANASNLQGVEFKPFGVMLEFVPYITDRDRIRLAVTAEVSVRNTDLSTNIGGSPNQGGTSVAGLNERTFQTTVEVREGQTLAVAGLIQANTASRSERVPFIGDLPLLGIAGSSNRITSGEQELVILITPELTRSIPDCTEIGLPGDDIYEPDDIEFFLHGRIESGRPIGFRSPIRTDSERLSRFFHENNPYLYGPVGYTTFNEWEEGP